VLHLFRQCAASNCQVDPGHVIPSSAGHPRPAFLNIPR
jgi:hypothetical protein